MRNRIVLGLLGLGLSMGASAATLTDDAHGYSLDFPSGWSVTKDAAAFTAQHSDGSSFEAMPANLPPNIKSVKVAALMGQAAALAAGLCDREPATEFELSGEGWVGNGFHCNNRPSEKTAASETIGVTVKRGDAFLQFLLFVPRQDWKTRSDQYLALFKSLRFRS